MKAKDSRGARRAAAKEIWRLIPEVDRVGSFPDHWRTLNDEHAQKRSAAEQRRKISRSAR